MTESINVSENTQPPTVIFDSNTAEFVLSPDIVPDVRQAIVQHYRTTGDKILPLPLREDGTASMGADYLNPVIGGLRTMWNTQRFLGMTENAARLYVIGQSIAAAAAVLKEAEVRANQWSQALAIAFPRLVALSTEKEKAT